jgi:1-deoxy-D-xylulose-5-phosphate reductoisomerase
VAKITLTASGGPLRTWTQAQLDAATPAEAVAHPNWSMGAKISVDSATMMNKGLEYIEAYHLFPVGLEKLGIVVHPQSVIHSMVEFRDRSTLAQLGPSDMRVPIASCLAWPQRMETPLAPLDLAAIGELTFFQPDEVRFPATRLAREAIRAGGSAPAILNAANEVAVAAFLAGQIAFTRIAALVEETLNRSNDAPRPASLAEVLDVDQSARMQAQRLSCSQNALRAGLFPPCADLCGQPGIDSASGPLLRGMPFPQETCHVPFDPRPDPSRPQTCVSLRCRG